MTLIPLKITSWIMGKEIKLIKSLEVNKAPLSHHLGLNKFRWEKTGAKCQVVSTTLQTRSSN